MSKKVARRLLRCVGDGLCLDLYLFFFWLASATSPSFAWMTPRNTARKQYHHRRLRLVSQENSFSNETPRNATSLTSALCVVPPDFAWDTIQRARHLARDATYHKWPPAIRLFHPFGTDLNVALDVARVIQQHNIQPFQVVLDQWNVIPNQEAIEADLKALEWLPAADDTQSEDSTNYDSEQDEVDALIEREARIGREKLELRQKKQRAAAKANKVQTTNTQQDEEISEESPKGLLEKQKQMYEEFNGPCVVCLEPNLESRERLVQLRDLLRTELFGDTFDAYSPSSSVSGDLSAQAMSSSGDYRPLLPVGGFPTVTSAIEMASKLKALWDPLVFNVTDLHFVSDGAAANKLLQDDDDDDDDDDNQDYVWQAEHDLNLDLDTELGCDALVMLVGEELEVDQEHNEEMIRFLVERGEEGGFAQSKEREWPQGNMYDGDEESEEEDDSAISQWLEEEDEDWDEGTVVVIGRTHFFTGETRKYVGMPASSALDKKDRVLGEGSSVSGAARRRGTIRRTGALWKEGEFGHRETDFSPWSKAERRRNKKVL